MGYLERKKASELKQIAKDAGIKGWYARRKAELLEALSKHMKAGPEAMVPIDPLKDLGITVMEDAMDLKDASTEQIFRELMDRVAKQTSTIAGCSREDACEGDFDFDELSDVARDRLKYRKQTLESIWDAEGWCNSYLESDEEYDRRNKAD